MTELMNNLDYDTFLNVILEKVSDRLGEGYEVRLHHVVKNNSVELDGLLIREGSKQILPSIYLNNFYESLKSGDELDKIVSGIISMYHNCTEQLADREIPDYSFARMKDSIIYRLVNYEKNKALLDQIPHIRIMDLAITFHCLISEENDKTETIRINNSHCNSWGVSTEQLIKMAEVNTPRLFPPVIRKIENILADMILKMRECGDSKNADDVCELITGIGENQKDAGGTGMYVLTNQRNLNGATCVLYPGLLDKLSKDLGNEYYILPSSVNEVILVPKELAGSVKSMIEMVTDINREQVPYEEVLSDNVYSYYEQSFVLAK